jgi:hypothetical protein
LVKVIFRLVETRVCHRMSQISHMLWLYSAPVTSNRRGLHSTYRIRLVLEKAGMTRGGRGRQVSPLKSEWSDNFEYSILETDKWLSQ